MKRFTVAKNNNISTVFATVGRIFSCCIKSIKCFLKRSPKNSVLSFVICIIMLNQINLNLSQTFFRTKEKHNFHLVDNSQLPIISAIASMLLVLNIVFYLHPSDILPLHFFDNMSFQVV